MTSKKTTVAQLAKEAGLGIDDTLIALWEAGLDGVLDGADKLQRGDANRARRALGLATRRELGSAEYWAREFGIRTEEVTALLLQLGVLAPFDGSRLRARAIHRLSAELRRRRAVEVSPATKGSYQEAAETPFEWEVVGHQREMEYLDSSQALMIHEALVADFALTPDPLNPPGVRSSQLLESALFRPATGIGAELKYPTVEMAAAALLHSLVHDHPFHNGNKRTALVAMLVFLDENGLVLTCDENELFKLVLQLAQHAVAVGGRHSLPDREVLAVARWIKGHSRLMEKGDRAVSWRWLRQRLTYYGCVFGTPSGNRINIERRVPAGTTWLGRRRERTIRVQTHYGDEGREVDKTALKRLRKELELDDDHGIDSAAFYDGAETSASEFITRYRKTLRRLAKL